MKKNFLELFPYKEIRPEQKNVLTELEKQWFNYKYFIINASPGVGKSAIAKSICNVYNSSIILTSTKQLQNQYLRDFDDIVSIKGRNNYVCNYDKRFNCDCAPCSQNPELRYDHIDCEYDINFKTAKNSPQVVTSYAYYLNTKNSWKNRSVIVLDECHNFDNILINQYQFKLDPYQLDNDTDFLSDINEDLRLFMMFTMDREKSGWEANKEWILKIFDLLKYKLNNMLLELKKQRYQIEDKELDEEELIEELLNKNKVYGEYTRIYEQLSNVVKNDNRNSNWIIEPDGKGLVFIPINVSSLFAKQIDQYKVVFMSASIVNIDGFLKELGLSRSQVCVIEQESSFDPNKSPIYIVPSGKLDYNNIDNSLPNVLNVTEKILNKHRDVKGIIHSTNYKITNSIINGIDNKRFIYRQDEKTSNIELLEKHSNNIEPTVLVSPSLTEGTDLKDDLSRFQIIVKLPFISLSDKRVKKKMEIDNDWYVCEMLKTLLQSCCRSTRSQDDWSKTYILDSSFANYIQRYSHWLPKSFIKRIRYMAIKKQ